MSRILDIISNAAKQEKEDLEKSFIAPVCGGRRVRSRIGGMIRTFSIRPRDFEGWGKFEVRGRRKRIAEMVETPMQHEIDSYLSRLPRLKFRLCLNPGDDSNWIAYPCNADNMKTKFGMCEPVVIRLVDGCSKFEAVNARHDGATWWFESRDASDNMMIVDQMIELSSQKTAVDSVRIKGMTPEMRKAYDIHMNPVPVAGAPDVELPLTDEQRIAQALERGGGSLLSFIDRGDRWTVEWRTSTGERHSSSISKEDMTVYSAGICLSGEDANFDLHTLVGIVERRNDYDDDYDDDW